MCACGLICGEVDAEIICIENCFDGKWDFSGYIIGERETDFAEGGALRDSVLLKVNSREFIGIACTWKEWFSRNINHVCERGVRSLDLFRMASVTFSNFEECVLHVDENQVDWYWSLFGDI